MKRSVLSLVLCCVAQIGCTSVQSYEEAMPAHPGLVDVLSSTDSSWELPGALPQVDAEAKFARQQRVPPPPRDAQGLPVRMSRPTLAAPASLAVVEFAAYSERGELPWRTGGAVWEPTPWAPGLHPPAVETVRRVRTRLVADPAHPQADWPAIGGPNLEPFVQVVGVPSFLLPSVPSLAGVRRAAATVGSDVVLVLGRRTRILEGHNALAVLYPLLVGFVLPAEETRVWTRYEAALIDVRSGGVLAVAQGEARDGWSSVPVAGGLSAHGEALRDCEQGALEQVLDELHRALAVLEGQGRFKPRPESLR